MRPSRERVHSSLETRASVVIPFPIPSSDFGLVGAIRASHPDAIQALCERYSTEMLTIAARILGPDSQVPQVVIDTLRRALARINEPFEPREFRSWLFVQLIDTIRQRLRARRRWRGLSLNSRQSWSEGVGCSERLRATYCIIDRMDEPLRLVFCVVAIHSLTVHETARLLNLTPDNVELLLDRACTFFLRHIPRSQRKAARKRYYYLSLGAEIVEEQDLVIDGWWICEDDLLLHPAQPRSLTGWRFTVLPVVLVLVCAAALLIARTDLAWARGLRPSRSTEVYPMQPQTSPAALSPLHPGSIISPAAARSQPRYTLRAR